MKVLVLNAGSTSIKFDLYEMDSEDRLAHGMRERVGPAAADVEAALAGIADELGARLDGLAAVGHRVVHGGERLIRPVQIDAAALAVIAECAAFAPLHNPANLLGIHAARARLPGVPQIAVFDTAFHGTMPEHAYVYALPHELYFRHGVRRYGFHGPSHQYMAACAAEELRADLSRLRLVTCHLGGGASVAAIDGGHSIDTSMGMTPLEGLMMGTRSGSIDPGILLAVLRDRRLTVEELAETLDHGSGLLGVSGSSADMRALQAAADAGDPAAALAIEMFVARAAAGIAAAATALRRLDAVVFTAGIGEGAGRVRAAIVDRLAVLDVAPIGPDEDGTDRILGGGGGPPVVIRIEAREDIVAARAAVDVLAGRRG